MRKFCAARPSSRDRPANLGTVPWPHAEPAGDARHRIHRRHLRHALQQAGEHGHLTLTVEPVDLRRRSPARQLGDVVERHAADRARGHRQLTDGLRRLPVPLGRSNVDLVLLAALVVRRDLIAADEQAQRLGGVRDLHAEVRGLEPVEVHGQLRLPDVQRRVEVDHARLLLRLRDDGAGVLLELLQIGTADRELNLRVLIAAAANRGDSPHARAEVRHADRGKHLGPHHVHQLELIAVPLVHGGQPNVDRAEILGPRRIVGNRHQGVADAGHLLNPARDAVRDDLRGLEAGALRRAKADFELRLIVVRQEVLVRDHEQRHAAEQDEDGYPGDDAPMRQRPAEDRRVAAIERAEEALVPRRLLVDRVAFGVFAPGLHLDPPRREHRRQREAHHERHEDRERHREAEARHEPPDDAAHEPDRHEDGHERQRRREDGEADLARCLDGRLHRRPALLFDESIDVLQHHDRIVDDDTDG